jgi:hypothetical protein
LEEGFALPDTFFLWQLYAACLGEQADLLDVALPAALFACALYSLQLTVQLTVPAPACVSVGCVYTLPAANISYPLMGMNNDSDIPPLLDWYKKNIDLFQVGYEQPSYRMS